jgi:hypothetical protein
MMVKLRFAAFLAAVVVCCPIARADFTYSESSAYNTIAALLLTNTSNTNDQGECAATSLMNSFQYLQNIAPSNYGTNLTGGAGTANAASSRDTLDGLITGGPQGGLQGDVWNAKLSWFNSHGGTASTTFEGITNTGMNSSQGTGYTVGTNNMTFGASGTAIWNFLADQINKGQDVEIGMFDHMVTLMGLKLSGTNMYAQIIDPNYPRPGGTGAGGMSNGAAGEWVDAQYDGTSGLVKLSGFSVGGTGYNNPLIYYAFAESPVSVPEPAAIALAATAPIGGVLIFRYRRRRRKS